MTDDSVPAADYARLPEGPVFNGVGAFAPGIARDAQKDCITRLIWRLDHLGGGAERLRARAWLRTLYLDPRAYDGALTALNELPTTDRRKLLFSQLARPAKAEKAPA